MVLRAECGTQCPIGCVKVISSVRLNFNTDYSDDFSWVRAMDLATTTALDERTEKRNKTHACVYLR